MVVETTVEAAPAPKHLEVPTLSIRHQQFADAWLACGNATNAAIATDYCGDDPDAPGFRTVAATVGWELLRRPDIAAYVAARRAEVQVHVDAAVVAAKIAAPVSVARMERIAAMDPEEHVQQPAPILRANEAIAGIAGIMPKGGGVVVNVDNRKIDTMAMELWQARKARERDEADV